MGLIQSASNLFGGALAPIIAIGLAVSLGWREAFYITAVPAFIMGLILMKYLRKPMMKTDIALQETKHKPTKKEFMGIFGRRNIWLGMIIAISNMLFIIGISTFFPLILANMSGFGDGINGLLLGLMGFMFFVGQAVVPAISDRIGRKPFLAVSTLIAIFLPVAIYFFYDNFTLLLISLIIFALGNGYQPLALAIIPAESVPPMLAASAMAALFLVAELIGGSLGPFVSGVLADQFGLPASMWLPMIGAAIAFLCSFGIQETAPAKIAKTSNDQGIAF